jgi:hypothetical protein
VEPRASSATADYPSDDGTRAWAVDLLREATARFGEHNFPDGRGVNFIIEDNVVQGNGERGGAAINLAGLQSSLIQNNLVYGNFAHGIAQWDNDNPYDREAREHDPRSGQLASAPIFGCHDNVVRNNTVIMKRAGRAALQAIRGSWGMVAYNNVLINDDPTSLEVDASSAARLDAGANVLNTALGPEGGSPAGARGTALGITRARFAAEVRRYGEQPWVILAGRWWQENPDRPDFHPLPGSALLAGRADPAQLPVLDLEGSPRRGADIGALAARRAPTD